MRCAELVGFVDFCEDDAEVPLSFVVVRGASVGCEMESERLRAAGSMSGIVPVGINSVEAAAWSFYGRGRRITVNTTSKRHQTRDWGLGKSSRTVMRITAWVYPRARRVSELAQAPRGVVNDDLPPPRLASHPHALTANMTDVSCYGQNFERRRSYTQSTGRFDSTVAIGQELSVHSCLAGGR